MQHFVKICNLKGGNRMKSISWNYPVLITVAVVFMVCGCGSGGSNGAFWFPEEKSTLTINTESLTSGPVGTTYSGVANDRNLSLVSAVTPSSIFIILSKSQNGVPEETFSLMTDGAAVNEYSVSTLTFLSYIKWAEEATVMATALTGTITITDIGSGSDERVKGSFDSIVQLNSGPTETARMWGTFNVERND
jgi:hypothetical protein